MRTFGTSYAEDGPDDAVWAYKSLDVRGGIQVGSTARRQRRKVSLTNIVVRRSKTLAVRGVDGQRYIRIDDDGATVPIE